MAFDEFNESGGFNPGDSRRITKIGRLLRNTKIDELPELFNILKGDMSFVGPRPEVSKYVNAYLQDYEVILIVRPGLSDFASIKYRDEEQILADKTDPEKYYRNVILPDKLQIAKNYVDKISLKMDLAIIKNTLKSVMGVFNTKNKSI
jgi:lipopolysaccharide/colanic/teichoic acid biosynthesis glycosyltransferase